MQIKRFTISVLSSKETQACRGALSVYLWDNSVELYDGLKRPVIIICPGGGYRRVSDREADSIASQFMAMGCHTAVLRYSTAPAVYPAALFQLASAVKLCRVNAEDWYIDDNKIIVLGCSAGGHLAGSLACFWNDGYTAQSLDTVPEMIKPNGQILCYPVITSGKYAHTGSFQHLLAGIDSPILREKLSLEKQVSKDTPPAFIWNSITDECVPAENALLYVQALRAHRIPMEYHLFPSGGHGIATATKVSMSSDGRGIQKECALWLKLAHNWLENPQLF